MQLEVGEWEEGREWEGGDRERCAAAKRWNVKAKQEQSIQMSIYWADKAAAATQLRLPLSLFSFTLAEDIDCKSLSMLRTKAAERKKKFSW